MIDRVRRPSAVLLASAAATLLWACASGASDRPESQTTNPTPAAEATAQTARTSFSRYVRSTDAAVGLAFDKRGHLLFAEKDSGRIIRFRRGRKTVLAKLGVVGGGEPGLLGLAVARNGNVFAYYTSSNASCPNPTRASSGGSLEGHCVWRFRPTSSGRLRADGRVFSAGHPSSANNHVGGGLHFGPDGALYLSIGDLGENDDPNNGPGRAQSLSVPFGKVLRLDPDGNNTPADGNPGECGNADNSSMRDASDKRIWACGLRNTYQFAFDVNGVMWGAEAGDSCDEINKVKPAVNYGWQPPRTDCSGKGAGTPVLKPGGTPSGITVLSDRKTGPWRNDVLFCRFTAGGSLMRYDQSSRRLSEVRSATGKCLFDMASRRNRVYISSGDSIYRLTVSR